MAGQALCESKNSDLIPQTARLVPEQTVHLNDTPIISYGDTATALRLKPHRGWMCLRSTKRWKK